jgi:outer membrane protein assembly factor BamB
VCTGDGGISSIAAGGTPRWRGTTDDVVASGPAVVDDIVFVGSGDNHVYALDAASGTQQWSFEATDRITSPPIATDGTLYVGDAGGTLYALSDPEPRAD